MPLNQLITLLGPVLCLLAGLSAQAETSHPGEDTPPGFSIELSPELQQLAGIRIKTLTETSPLPDIMAYAKVINPQPLLEGLTRLRQLAIQLKARQSIAGLAKTRYLRLQSLGNSTQRSKVEQAKQDWLIASSEVETLKLKLQQENAGFVTQWGTELRQWAENQPVRLTALRQGKIRLVGLVSSQSCKPCPKQAAIEYHQQIIPLDYVASLPSADPVLNRAGFLFIAEDARLPVGQRLTGWFTQSQNAIVIPASAVVWRSGAPWVFVQTEDNRFQRRRLLAYRQGIRKWWVNDGLISGEKVVVDGAQILLSSAFREQVPEEDDDD
ncbi:MAG: hypothetical protein AXA67_12945 [Methylothermaceae bacteria B42]|nr:MAG: hypothetical protein AXA67_12945 [Methylothermaceae bacteria B42]HHJ38469.1 hypothetical protein [Methylothermaceae bacterium]